MGYTGYKSKIKHSRNYILVLDFPFLLLWKQDLYFLCRVEGRRSFSSVFPPNIMTVLS